MSAEQVAAAQAEADAQKKADRYWEPQLETWKQQLRRGGEEQSHASEALASVRDPHAVPTIKRVFGREEPELQLLCVRILSGIKGSEASRAITEVSLYARSAEVRKAAVEELQRRDPRDFMGALIETLHRPLNFQVTPHGAAGRRGVIEIEGERVRSRRIYWIPPTENSAQWARYTGRTNMDRDLERIHRYNGKVSAANAPVIQVLQTVTGQWIGRDPDDWRRWWYDQLGYSYESPKQRPVRTSVHYVHNIRSCFGQRTPVLTLTGPRAIETLRIGDLVLSQDTQTGSLSYEPVVGLHKNPPMATLRLRLGNEEIIATTYHRFWLAGQGWAMARELKTGEILRSLGGRIELASIEAGTEVPVFNLDVARNCTYFVGKNNILVHDNSLPPSMLTPFDAEPLLEALADDSRESAR